METFNFSVPQDITVGKGSLSKLPEIAKKLGGKHALIISGPHLEKMGLVKKAADYLASVDIKADTFTDIEANPSVTTVEKATAKYLESGADFIVAFGGGSPMDVAKAVGVVAKYGGSVTDYEGAHKVPGPIVPLIAIPTTAGTGSEVTAFSVKKFLMKLTFIEKLCIFYRIQFLSDLLLGAFYSKPSAACIFIKFHRHPEFQIAVCHICSVILIAGFPDFPADPICLHILTGCKSLLQKRLSLPGICLSVVFCDCGCIHSNFLL